MNKKKIGIIGATGYTGSELMRILVNHPNVQVDVITSESRKGEKFSDVHPFFQGIVDQELKSADEIDNYDLDLVFLALPHGVSMDFVKKFKDKPFKIVDLSGDFRLDSQQTYEEWYKMDHHYPEGIKESVFGLPELFSGPIKKSHLIANPGCFPTSAILAAAPLMNEKILADYPLIVDSKTGVTGAGVKAKPVNQYSNVNDNFKAYKLKFHRHTVEMESILKQVGGKAPTVQFTPHLLPVDRGILSTIYANPKATVTDEKLQKLYQRFYQDAPFVRIRKNAPAIKDVRGTNYCDLYVTYDDRTNMILVVSVIDNLVKGAAGQAVQNMNLMFGFDETTGLSQVPLNP